MSLSAEALKGHARSLGFDLVGIAPAVEADGFDQFADWLDAGYAGTMDYLHRHAPARRHPRAVLAEVRSVVMLGAYHANIPPAPAATATATAATARVARYAHSPDYHDVLRQKLNALADWVREREPGCVSRGVVDTAPLLERDFARRAGLGWIGKNTMLINKYRGSYLMLAALLTSATLPPDPPHTASHCGSCTACLDACPTQAFVRPGVLDARLCISYLTIELKGPIPVELRASVGDWLFGCDVCQEVCPWNRHAEATSTLLPTRPELVALDPAELLALSEEQFRQRFRGTVMFRSKRRGLLRNAAIVLGNRGDPAALPVLQRALDDPEPLVREAAAWAIERIRTIAVAVAATTTTTIALSDAVVDQAET